MRVVFSTDPVAWGISDFRTVRGSDIARGVCEKMRLCGVWMGKVFFDDKLEVPIRCDGIPPEQALDISQWVERNCGAFITSDDMDIA